MKILLLGGTGFIGSYLARQLLESGHEIAVFHRGQREDAPTDDVAHIHGDRKHLSEYAQSFDAFGAQVVVDLLAFNEEDARSLTETFRGRAERLVCLSSMDIYRSYGCFRRLEAGPSSSQPFAEEAPLRTTLYPYRALAKGTEDLFYNYDKIPVERIVMKEDRLPATVLRLPQVFGPHDRQHRLRAYLKQMDAGEDILLSEAKAAWRCTRGYVEDIAFGISLAITAEKAAGRVYNIGEKETGSEVEWIRQIGREAGWRGEIRTLPDAAVPEDAMESYDWSCDLVADTQLIRNELGYREVVSTEVALQRTIAWERSEQ
ncbi:MAG TPA: NAD-dependent epimerase/dehydratase family protein [Chthoniobacterales bacterium]|nr:NAD-dependent epimerase/dehydratase family protein [Chthoniobacterales bacterium]